MKTDTIEIVDDRVDTFVNRLQAAMEARGMKKAELSRMTGISQQRIGQYVLGRYEAKQTAVYFIARALEVDPAWLIGFDVPMDAPGVRAKTVKKKKRATR